MSQETAEKLHILETVEQDKRHLFETYSYGENIHSPERVMNDDFNAEQAQYWLLETLAKAKLSNPDTFIAIVAGSFDVPHPNHEWYLRDCRLRAAQQMLESEGIESASQRQLQQAIASDQLKLIVSIDSDKSIDVRKSGDPSKGGVKRPIYPWSVRAERIAGYTFDDPNDGKIHYVADVVSKECRVDFANTSMERCYDVAKMLDQYGLLSSYIAYGEHQEDIDFANSLSCKSVIIPLELVYAHDPRTNQNYKSSGIIKQAQGDFK
jgi:hypothetical protein